LLGGRDRLAHERRTAFAKIQLVLRGESAPRELAGARRDAQLLGQFVDETAGAGSAGLVHAVVQRDAVRQVDVLAVLPAQFKDRIHARINVPRRARLRRDLVSHQIRPDELADQVAAGTRHPGGAHAHAALHLGGQFRHHLLDGL